MKRPLLMGGLLFVMTLGLISPWLSGAFGATIGAQFPGQRPADMILRNAVVYTVDSANTLTEALAIRDGKIVAVGSTRDVMTLKGKGTRVIDLGGKFVMPGFNDSHVHFASAAQFLEFNIMRVTTQEEFVARVKDVVSRLKKGEWILGGYWGAYEKSASTSPSSAFSPDIAAVEQLTRDNPMCIRKFDDSEFGASSEALKLAGIDSQNPKLPEGARAIAEMRRQGTEPAGSKTEGVEFVRDSSGRFNGHLRGRGVLPLFTALIPKTFSHERRLQQTRNALAEIRRFGVTNISDMSDDEQLDIYRE